MTCTDFYNTRSQTMHKHQKEVKEKKKAREITFT